jgi:integrase
VRTHAKDFSHLPITDISHLHIDEALKVLRHTAPATARRTLALWARVFSYAMAKQYRPSNTINPAQWKDLHSHFWPSRGRTIQRHFAAMDYRHLPEFMARLRLTNVTARAALEFLILTASRTSEVLKMTWDEVNFDTKVWTVPAHRIKMGREHHVPLSDRAVELLLQMQRRPMQMPHPIFVFPSRRPNLPMNEQILLKTLRTIGYRGSTVHGFRSSFRTWGGEQTEYPREIIEMCLAHQVGNAVERAYWRGNALDKRRVIMDAWAAFCSGSEPFLVAASKALE